MRLQGTTSKQTHRVAALAPKSIHLTYVRVNTARPQRILCHSTASDSVQEEKNGSSGSVWGSALLVSGTTIGAGILVGVEIGHIAVCLRPELLHCLRSVHQQRSCCTRQHPSTHPS